DRIHLVGQRGLHLVPVRDTDDGVAPGSRLAGEEEGQAPIAGDEPDGAFPGSVRRAIDRALLCPCGFHVGHAPQRVMPRLEASMKVSSRSISGAPPNCARTLERASFSPSLARNRMR